VYRAHDRPLVEIEEVVVGRIYPLPLIKAGIELACQGRIGGLQASVAEEERGLIGGSGN